MKYPVLCDKRDNKLTFDRYSHGYQMHITGEELEAAYRVGYDMHIVKGCVSDNSDDIYTEFITHLYEKRKIYKKQMNENEKQGDIEGFNKYNILQKICKDLMNSVYGRLGWSAIHEVSNYLSSDSEFLLQ